MSVPAAHRMALRASLRARGPRVILLLREGAFASTVSSGCEEATPLGPLVDYLRAVLERQRRGEARLGGVLGEARSYQQQLALLRVCINELLPLLRASGRGPAQSGESGPPISDAEFRMLQRRALALGQDWDKPVAWFDSTDELAAMVGAPCVILGSAVMPLSPVTSLSAQGPFFTVGGTRYAACPDRGNVLSELLLSVRREQVRRSEQSLLRERPELTEAASEFVRDVKAILDRFGSRDCGRYRLFHRDADHQLQHSRGHWVLVRGPVTNRMVRGDIFVGLALIGPSRRDWLAVSPRPAAGEGDFWAPDGNPLIGGLCMGNRGQYLRLLSDEFTDAEAVVEWLDSGVIVATNRSEQHRRWRAARQGRLHGCRLAS